MKYFFFILIFLLSCSSSKLEKVEWTGEFVQEVKEPVFLYWKNGNQFQRHQKDSIEVNFSGFRYEDAIYILLLIENNGEKPIHLITKNSSLSYKIASKEFRIKPSTTRNLDNNHFSFINTLIEGTGKISRLFLNLPIDVFLPENKSNDNKMSKDMNDNDLTHKVIFSNHTLFQNMLYGGLLVFEIDEEHSEKKFEFDLNLDLGIKVNANGKF